MHAVEKPSDSLTPNVVSSSFLQNIHTYLQSTRLNQILDNSYLNNVFSAVDILILI